MIQWCAYCQKFTGYVHPMLDFDLTHGICRKCLDLITATGHHDPKAHDKQIFFSKLSFAATSLDLSVIAAMVDDGFHSGITGEDLLIRILQPSLYEIGQLWERGAITVADEHKFSAYTTAIIDILFAKCADMALFCSASAPTVLLILAEHNLHVLGLRMVEFLLASKRIPSFAIYQTLTPQQIFEKVQQLKPRYVAVSVSMPEQMPSVLRLREHFNAAEQNIGIAVGGYPFKIGATFDPAYQIDICADGHGLLRLLT